MKRAFSLIAASMASMVAATCTDRTIGNEDALVIIDVQNCFMEGGSLGVGGSLRIIPTLQAMIDKFEAANANIVVSLDWHPENHCSFREKPEGAPVVCPNEKPEAVAGCREVDELCQDERTRLSLKDNKHTILWPVHCIVPSDPAQRGAPNSAQLWKGLKFKKPVTIIKKGYNPMLDAYSAAQGTVDPEAGTIKNGEVDLKWENTPAKMVEKAGEKPQTLEQWATDKGISTLYQTGIATDFCVKFTITDSSGFKSKTDQLMMADAMIGVDVPDLNTIESSVKEMTALPNTQWAKNNAGGVCAGVDENDALKMQLAFKKVQETVAAKSGVDSPPLKSMSAMEKLGKLRKAVSAKLGEMKQSVASAVQKASG